VLIANHDEIAQFVNALFRYADPGTVIALRSFEHQPGRPARIQGWPRINGDLSGCIQAAARAATEAANAADPMVFAPPIATFNPLPAVPGDKLRASEDNMANGVALSVEIDEGDPRLIQRKLEALIGPATVVVASGGEWTDPDTGEVHPKLHLHWRLSEPTRASAEHMRLKAARRAAKLLAGADGSAIPSVHPLRWAGSWHRKGKPRLAMLAGGDDTAEIHLDEALERLEEAVEAAGIKVVENAGPITPGKPQAELRRLVSALTAIPNADLPWDEWTKIGLLLYRATSGSADGMEAWDNWSAQSGKHVDGACDERWAHFHTSPPTRGGAGTLFYMAKANGWADLREHLEPPADERDEGYWASIEGDAAAEPDSEPDSEPAQEAKSKAKANAGKAPLDLVWFDEITPSLEANDYVQGLLCTSSSIVIYGDSNAGKTFWATDLALHIAAGDPWCKRRVEQGGVIYCVLEGGIGFRNRVSAWKAARGLENFPLPFAAIQSGLNLLDPDADTHRLIEAVQRAKENMDVPVKLIVIDTLARAMAGGNENAPDDMGALVRNMDLIRAETGASVMFIHHSGKDQAKGARGHSSLRAAIDTEIEVAVDETTARTATVVKQREMKKGDVFGFTLKVVELGTNRHGEAVTTCTVEYGATDQAAGAVSGIRSRLTGHSKRAFEVLTDLCASAGRTGERGVPSGCSSIPEKWWRDRFYERAMPGTEQEAKKKAFQRVSTLLLNMKMVGMDHGRCWVVSRDETKRDIYRDISDVPPDYPTENEGV
jgi:hypothetical protein